MNWIRWKCAAEHVGDGLDRQRLREAGNALDQQVPAGEQADEHALEHLVLPGDDALDLEDGALDPRRGRRLPPLLSVLGRS